MSEIIYKKIHEFEKEDLKDLFLSVEWFSGHFSDKPQISMRNFESIISAWDGDKLVALICAMDDGIMTAYVHYLLVKSDYQDFGIGKELVLRIRNIYKDYLRIVVAYNDEIGFYENCGFKKVDDTNSMLITELWT